MRNEKRPSRQRFVPDPATVLGIADARMLPSAEFDEFWAVIEFEGKERLARQVAVNLKLRAAVSLAALPLHGVTLLIGRPGTGKTTLARGLASRLADIVRGLGSFLFLEVDPHALVSSALGRSQQRVDEFFRTTLSEVCLGGPTIVLFDEIETVFADRAALSFEANPLDVHRAVDAALTGLDRLAVHSRELVIIATSNFPQALDQAIRSRADHICEMPLPNERARDVILRSTVLAVDEAFPGARRALEGREFAHAVKRSEGLDGRRLKKAVAAACSVGDGEVDPANLGARDILSAIDEMLSVDSGGQG